MILGYYGCTAMNLQMCRILFYHPEQINEYYGLKLVGKLDKNSGTSDVYIVDKKRNLEWKEKKGYKEGYDTFHPAELSNEMLDDLR
jgi:hypothetical protein